jgi:hypothetical protein
LPSLITDRADREKMLTLFEKLIADERVQNARPSDEQIAMLARIRAVLSERRSRERRPAAAA